MTDSIRRIFDQNIRLLGFLDKAVILFREQQYDKALEIVADSTQLMKSSIDAIITDREYFRLVSTDTVLKMLASVLEAKRNKDFILLADLLELQLISFLCGVQELIIGKEEFVFEEDKYLENIKILKENGFGLSGLLSQPMNPEELLNTGYRIEFTSCGLMTLAAENAGTKYYFHTNSRVHAEAFLLARHWYREVTRNYILYGLGMGYHVSELAMLSEVSEIEVYEADKNVILLACAFGNMKEVFGSGRVKLIYDPDYKYLDNRTKKLPLGDVFHIHYPSFQNIMNAGGRKLVESRLPRCKTIENC